MSRATLDSEHPRRAVVARRGCARVAIAAGALVALALAVLPVPAGGIPDLATQPRGSLAPDAEFAPDRVLVAYDEHVPEWLMATVEASTEATHLDTLGTGTRILEVPEGTVREVVADLSARPAVRYAEPDYELHPAATPNDPHFGDQWGLHNTGQTNVDGKTGTPDADVDAPEAWEVTVGSADVVVGVIDDGVNDDHPDLDTNIWRNPQGVKDCPKGSHGYDFTTDSCWPDSGNHGTGVAGVLGAVGDNGTGIAGMAWHTRMISLRIALPVYPASFSSTLADAIDWAVDARDAGVNVRVLNVSYGGEEADSQALEDAILWAGEHGILVVTSAGNSGRNVDADEGYYPCSYDATNLICVAASDNRDELDDVSNWGAESVHLAAPGERIYTTCCSGNSGGYSWSGGTSYAAPFVAGVAALLWSDDPGLSVEEVRSKILGNVDELDSLKGKVATGGRLNAHRSLTGSGTWSEPPPSSTTSSSSTTTTTVPSGDGDGGSGGGGSGGGDDGGSSGGGTTTTDPGSPSGGDDGNSGSGSSTDGSGNHSDDGDSTSTGDNSDSDDNAAGEVGGDDFTIFGGLPTGDTTAGDGASTRVITERIQPGDGESTTGDSAPAAHRSGDAAGAPDPTAGSSLSWATALLALVALASLAGAAWLVSLEARRRLTHSP